MLKFTEQFHTIINGALLSLQKTAKSSFTKKIICVNYGTIKMGSKKVFVNKVPCGIMEREGEVDHDDNNQCFLKETRSFCLMQFRVLKRENQKIYSLYNMTRFHQNQWHSWWCVT